VTETKTYWEGVKGSSEHRTVGSHRAWCHQDSTWCYPSSLCGCCYAVSLAHEVCPTCEGEGYVLKGQDEDQS
jgi:hypothetical protein